MWWCKVRTVKWMQQHFPSRICDDLFGAPTCVWPSVIMEEQHFRYFSVGTNSMKAGIWTWCLSVGAGVHFCLPSTQFTGITPFSSQKTVTTVFQLMACLNFFFLVSIIWRHSFGYLLGFGFKWLDPGFSIFHGSQRLEAITSSFILLLKISGDCFLSLCVHLSVFLALTEHGPLNNQALR